ncbi:MAG: hypothetical protein LUH51_05795 [Firmicutes bacterium]|nr:hypothetical protein [Bacillota bacterium]
MTLEEQVYAQAQLLAQDLEDEDQALLELLCSAAVSGLRGKLRANLEPEDCLADFVAAASLYALAAISESGSSYRVEQFTAGDLTVRQRGSNAAACCLRYQADLMMHPYIRDTVAFMGV